MVGIEPEPARSTRASIQRIMRKSPGRPAGREHRAFPRESSQADWRPDHEHDCAVRGARSVPTMHPAARAGTLQCKVLNRTELAQVGARTSDPESGWFVW